MGECGYDPAAIWVRVDDRLIHGQVTVGWRQHLRYAQIWVVDDTVGDDPYLQDALRLAAPEGVEIRVYSVEEAVALWASGVKRETPRVRAEGGSRQALLLVRSPQVALALVEGGMPLSRLNVGNLSARPGSVRAYKNISLTRAHVEALDALAEHGVSITFQLTPEDAQVQWSIVRQRVKR